MGSGRGREWVDFGWRRLPAVFGESFPAEAATPLPRWQAPISYHRFSHFPRQVYRLVVLVSVSRNAFGGFGPKLLILKFWPCLPCRQRSEKRCLEGSACHRQARRRRDAYPPLGSAANVAPHSVRSPASLEPAKGDPEMFEPFWEPIETHSVSDLRSDLEKSWVWALTILAGRD